MKVIAITFPSKVEMSLSHHEANGDMGFLILESKRILHILVN